jgi:hypothetical protein
LRRMNSVPKVRSASTWRDPGRPEWRDPAATCDRRSGTARGTARMTSCRPLRGRVAGAPVLHNMGRFEAHSASLEALWLPSREASPKKKRFVLEAAAGARWRARAASAARQGRSGSRACQQESTCSDSRGLLLPPRVDERPNRAREGSVTSG